MQPAHADSASCMHHCPLPTKRLALLQALALLLMSVDPAERPTASAARDELLRLAREAVAAARCARSALLCMLWTACAHASSCGGLQ